MSASSSATRTRRGLDVVTVEKGSDHLSWASRPGSPTGSRQWIQNPYSVGSNPTRGTTRGSTARAGRSNVALLRRSGGEAVDDLLAERLEVVRLAARDDD